MDSIKSPTRKIRTQLEILLHSQKCATQTCDVTNCGEFKSVLLHMNNCKEGRACQGVHCASSTQILKHWETCQNNNCILCSPIRGSGKVSEKYSQPTEPGAKPGLRPAELRSFQNWARKDVVETELTQPEMRYPRPPTERKRTVGGMTKESKTTDSGFYGNGSRTDNLSDEMKLSIREAVQTAMNNMIPQLETMVRTAIRAEIANLLLGQQGTERMLQSPKPYLTSPMHYSTSPGQFPSAQTAPYPPAPTQPTQYATPSPQTSDFTPSQSPQFSTQTSTPNFEQQKSQFTTQTSTPSNFEQKSPYSTQTSSNFEQKSPYSTQTSNPNYEQTPQTSSKSMPPPTKPVTPAPPTFPPQELTMTPPSQQALTMTPPSQQALLPSNSSQQHQVTSPLFTAPQQTMVPPSSAHNLMSAAQHSPQNLHTLTSPSQHGVPSPATSLTSPSPARSSEQLYVQNSSPLDSQHNMTSRDSMTSREEIASRQSLTSQLMAPSPQQQFTDQNGDQFMSMPSELHSYF